MTQWNKSVLERAIVYAEEHRHIHVLYIQQLQRFPPRTAEDRAYRKHVGGIGWHRKCVQRYDTILKALRAAEEAAGV